MCARGDGIRRSKDLRAEIGKFPNSTNERKKMSNKTIFKRIALVAITALGAGVLSVTSASATPLTADELDVDTVTQSVNVGACSVSTGGQGGTFVTGSLVQMTLAASVDSLYLTLAGPAAFEGGTAITTAALSGTSITTTAQTYLSTNATTNGRVFTVRLTGTGAVTVTTAGTATSAAVDSFTINSVTSCSTSTFNAGKSNVTLALVAETDTDSGAGTVWASRFNGADTSDADVVTNTGTGYMRAQLNNEYGDDLSSKPIVASTNSASCWVAVEASDATEGVATAPAATTAVMTGTGADLTVAVKQATAGTAVNCTVTLTWNGITVGTKTFKLQGAPATVTVSDVTVGEVGGRGYYRATVKDALGNSLPGIAISADATQANNAASVTVVSSAARTSTTDSSSDASTGAKYGVTPAITAGNLASAAAAYTCTTKGGAAKITVRAVQSGVTYVTSAPFDVYCGGTTLDTWSMSFDKATYSPGEIATLTITGKDADGLLMHSLEAIGALTQSFGGMTFVTTPTSADLFNSAAGAKSYQLSVGTTEGAFVGTLALTTATTDSKAKTIQYTVKSSTATVTNADVLKSIVSLIASINKQIQALQKLILRR